MRRRLARTKRHVRWWAWLWAGGALTCLALCLYVLWQIIARDYE